MRAPSDWPGAERRHPPLSSPVYAVRAPLAAWLQEEAGLAAARYGRYRVLDVGCGQKPYFPFFAPYTSEYVGVDVAENSLAELHGPVEALPVPDGSFDVVLCTQVLEHCADPAQAVRELARVVAPGGRVLVSTHGVQVYHPAPLDHWRWTHSGLELLFAENATWSSLSVRPASGTAACVGMLLAIYIQIAFRRARLAPIGRVCVWGLNRGAAALDRSWALLREPGPGTLFANYHVVAEAPA